MFSNSRSTSDTKKGNKKLFLYRWILNSFICFLLGLAIFMSFPADESNPILYLFPDTHDGFVRSAEIVLEHPNSRDLPKGFWVDEEQSTERVVIIRHWTGAWNSYSRSSSIPDYPLRSEIGLSSTIPGIALILLSAILGILVTLFIPLKHSLFLRYIW